MGDAYKGIRDAIKDRTGLDINEWPAIEMVVRSHTTIPQKVHDAANRCDEAENLLAESERTIEALKARSKKFEDEVLQLNVQLAGCLLASEGGAFGNSDAHKGMYGWSVAFESVKGLYRRYEDAKASSLDAKKMLDWLLAKYTRVSHALLSSKEKYRRLEESEQDIVERFDEWMDWADGLAKKLNPIWNADGTKDDGAVWGTSEVKKFITQAVDLIVGFRNDPKRERGVDFPCEDCGALKGSYLESGIRLCAECRYPAR